MTAREPLTPAQSRALLITLAPFAGSIERVVLYGSRARGTHRPGSDIDLLIVGSLDTATMRAVGLALDESALSVAVDLIRDADVADPTLRSEVLRDARTLFTREQLCAAALTDPNP